MKLIIMESPYMGATQELIDRNVRYARACMKDCLMRGEAPMVSHLLYTQVMRDHDPRERQIGIDAGLAWRTASEGSVVYIDLGVSPGMEYGIMRARESGKPVEYRTLEGWTE